MELGEYDRMFEVESRHWWYQGLHELTLSTLRSKLAAVSKPKILDAGCGTGGLLSRFDAGWYGVGLDLSQEALTLAKRRGLRDLVSGSLNDLPFEEASFDAVVSNDVICHKQVDDPTAVREFFRVLRPGGYLFLETPAIAWLESPHDRHVHTKHRYGREEFGALLLETGFQVEQISYRNCFLFPIVVTVRLMKELLVRCGVSQDSSDVRLPGSLINSILLGVLRLENRILRQRPLPLGSSVFAVCRRPAV